MESGFEFLKGFNDRYKEYVEEVMDKNGNVNSHTFPARIYVEDEQYNYEIVDIEMNYLGGCGCPSDITIKIKKVDDD